MKKLKRQVSTLALGYGVDWVSVLIWVDLKIRVVNSFPIISQSQVLFLFFSCFYRFALRDFEVGLSQK